MIAEVTPEVSVVVATRERAALLPRLVAALERQTLPRERFEVIVVDDASRDDTSARLRDLAGSTPIELRWSSTPTRRGPAAARNLGWRAARGTVIAFTDDDCVPDPGWLEAGLRAMGGRPRVIVGRTIPPDDQDDRRGPFCRVIRVEGIRRFETCNVFYRRADLERVAGFDERFTQPAGEDVDLGWRVTASAVEACYVPQALVYHDIRPSRLIDAIRDRQRGDALPLVFALHPDRREEQLVAGVFTDVAHPLVLLAVIGALASVQDRRWSLLAAPWFIHRWWVRPAARHPARRLLALPGALLVDLSGATAMLRGSLRARTLVL